LFCNFDGFVGANWQKSGLNRKITKSLGFAPLDLRRKEQLFVWFELYGCLKGRHWFMWTKHGVTKLREYEGAKAMARKIEDDLLKYGILNLIFFLVNICFYLT